MKDNFFSHNVVNRIDKILIDAYGSNLNNLNDSVVNLFRDCKMEILRLQEIERQIQPGILKEITGEVSSFGKMPGWGKGKDE